MAITSSYTPVESEGKDCEDEALPESPRKALEHAIRLLVAAGVDGLQDATAALLALSIQDLREAWTHVSDPLLHDMLFRVVQERSRRDLPRFEGYTADLLRVDAERYGWSIGAWSYGGPRVIEAGRGRLTVGRYCSMADPRVVLGNHQTRSATSYPFMDLWAEWPGTRVGLTDHVPGDVTIGNDVWIGLDVILLPGARIGDGAVIGAGAVVRGDVPPYAVFAGNPGCVRRSRFAPDLVARFLAVRWWDWPDAVVDRYLPLLLGPDATLFLEAAEREFGLSRPSCQAETISGAGGPASLS